MAALAWQAISGWGAGRMSGHGTLVPIPNGWRVFWRGLDWERYPGLSPGTISGCAGRYSGRRPERYSRAGARERGGARDFSPDSQWVAGVLAGEELGNDIPGFRPGRYPAAPDDIQAWRPERYSRAGARERRGHGILVPFPNWWRVFWRGQDWGTISRAFARDDIRLRRTISACGRRYTPSRADLISSTG